MRADFTLAVCDERERLLRWEQRMEGSPFARLLKTAETEVQLTDAAGGRQGGMATEVTIELRQALHGFFSRFGGYMVRRAATTTSKRRSTAWSGSVARRRRYGMP